jgi:hypothetical protein
VIGKTHRRLLAFCMNAFLVGCAVLPSNDTHEGFRSTADVEVKSRGSDQLFIKNNHSYYFSNDPRNCVSFSIPGEWEFSKQRAAIQLPGGKGFVGVQVNATDRLPGPDPVSRALGYFRQQDRSKHGPSIRDHVEPFESGTVGSVILFYEPAKMDIGSLSPDQVKAARAELGLEEGEELKLEQGIQSRVLIPFPPESVIVVTTSDQAIANDMITSLRVLSDEEIVERIQSLRKRNEGLVLWMNDIREKFTEVF